MGKANDASGGGQIAMCRVYVNHGVWSVRLCYRKGWRKGERVPVEPGFSLAGACYRLGRQSNPLAPERKEQVHRCLVCKAPMSRDRAGVCGLCEKEGRKFLLVVVVR